MAAHHSDCSGTSNLVYDRRGACYRCLGCGAIVMTSQEAALGKTGVAFDRERAAKKGEVDQRAKCVSAERLPELADELRRRAFSEVQYSGAKQKYVSYMRVDAYVDLSTGIVTGFGRHAIAVAVIPSLSTERYTVSAAVNDVEGYKVLRPGREVTFDGALLFVDDFLAGFQAGKTQRGRGR